MKIELKKIAFSERMSEETNCFAADLYINDVKAGYAKNQGHGGPTDYDWHDERGKKLIAEAEAYCKTLPPLKFEAGGEAYTVDMDLEQFIDELLNKHLEEKAVQSFRKKMDKAMEQGIVVGIPDESFGTWKLVSPIGMILVHPNGPDMLKTMLTNKVIPQMKEGEKILNTNIPEKILKEAGLKEDQYIKPKEANRLQQKQNPSKRKGRGL